MTDPLAALTAIVRERHQSGAYGNCHLQAHPTVVERLKAATTPPERHPAPACAPDGWADAWRRLLAIPIVPDDSLPEGAWRLVAVDHDLEPPHERRETIVKEGTVT